MLDEWYLKRADTGIVKIIVSKVANRGLETGENLVQDSGRNENLKRVANE